MNRKYFSLILVLLTLSSLLLGACNPTLPQETEVTAATEPANVSAVTTLASEPPAIHESIEEAVVVDQEGILVRVTSLDFTNPKGPALIYEIENKSLEAIGSFFYDVSVNGIMIQPTFTFWEGPKEEDPHEHIPPGEAAGLDMIFPAEALQRALIEKIQEIEFALYIMNSDTKINLVDARGIQIKTVADPSYIQTFDEEGMVAHDSDDLMIIVRLADTFPGQDEPPDPSLPLLWVYIENKQEEQRVVLAEEMQVNGIEVFNGFQSYLGGNKKEYTYIYLDRQAYQKHNFESIEELSVRFQVRSGDYAQNPLYSTDPVFFDFEEGVPSPAG